ncbi:MAG: phage portal protein [Rhodocyclaceae bacterium]|nr:phage portal protein [Rhodocyclaceae bacterium]
MARRKGKRNKAAPTAVAPVSNRFDAAGSGRRLRGWVAPASGPNRAIRQGATTLRNRARDAARNEWAAKATRTRWAVNLVGTGIVPRPRKQPPDVKRLLTDLWDAWVPVADADGTLDFYGLQAQVAGNWIESGELFVRLRTRRVEDGLPVPLQLQLIESDVCPLWDSRANNGNEIRQGIEFDRVGRRVAYWMYRDHPNDDRPLAATDLVRVPADMVIHVFEPTRPGQIRGVSEFSTILAKLRGVADFDDAVLDRQKLANLFAFFITNAGNPAVRVDPLTGLPAESGDDGEPMAPIQPGTGQVLNPGEEVTFSDPPGPGADYDDYMRIQSQHLAAGSGLPYELLTGDLRDVSDRALRVIVNEFRRHCEQRQWHILIPQLCRRVRNEWAALAALAGAIPADLEAAARSVTWVPQGWPYFHPTQDVQAERQAVEAGFKSRDGVITARGDDPEAIDEQRAEGAERETRLILPRTGG